MLALDLRQILVPAIDRFLLQLLQTEREGTHEIVARGAIPIPHLDQETLVTILRLQLTVVGAKERELFV